MNETSGYEAPSLTEIGSLHELTLQTVITKNGAQGDLLSNIPALGNPTGSITITS